jgi:hypothetical protein
MSRDPFDEMRNRNPVPPEDQPPAPMSVAARIMGGRERTARRSLPGFAVAAMTALAVVVAGGTLLLLTRPPADDGFGAGGTTTSTTATTATTAATTTTVAEPPATGASMSSIEVAVFFLAESVGDGWAGGPFLFPIAMEVQVDEGEDAAAKLATHALLKLFVGGPETLLGPGDSFVSSAVPADTAVLGLYDIVSGVVTVDLSSAFVAGGGSFSMQARLAQVVYTLTGIDGIDGVRFSIDGAPTTVFGGDGVMVSDPATRDDFTALLPAIMIESPAFGGLAGVPLAATGTANVYEATVSAALADENGLTLWEGFTTATCGSGCRGDWELEIPYDVAYPQWGSLTVWEESAEDGRRINVREHRVRLTPAAIIPSLTGCSGLEAATSFVEQDGLPGLVADRRAVIWDAAVECDWDQLARQLGSGLSYSFGEFASSFGADGDPIAFWQRLEATDEEPIRFLAELLNLPYATIDGPDGPIYVWPAAFAYDDWADVPATVREILHPLYGEADFDDFDGFGMYIGYRIGIGEDGRWRFFIAGD